LAFLTVDGADVAIFAGVRGTTTGVPLATDLDVWVKRVGAILLVRRSGLSVCSRDHSNDNMVSDEVPKFLKMVEGQVI